MNRIDRVGEKIKTLSSKVRKSDIFDRKNVGYSAGYIAELIGSQRNNITTDLNNLYKEGKLIKISGKPVLFFDRETFEKMFSVKLQGNSLCCKNLNEFINDKHKVKEEKYNDIFQNIIGSEGSLSIAIKQAKAAILYPPQGLHTIIFGETGVGKSMFAEAMYKYGKSEGIFNSNSPFVVFNCADYANNPQLLLSQLFGYSKGSFTGAETEKPGLIEIADGGVLLLDEVHRLPPEGQEMLFTFIDKGIFRRMGEINNERTAKVLIIAATTENPDSSLLKTFTRRIPMSIELPPLRERKLSERFGIIKRFFIAEAVRLNNNIIVDKDVFEALLTYNPVGNVGQIKSDIQLSIARAFLEFSIKKLSNVFVTIDFVPEYIKNGLLSLDKETRLRLNKMLVDSQYSFNSDSLSEVTIQEPKYDFIKYFYEKMNLKLDSEVNIQKTFRDFTQIVSHDMYSANKIFDFIDDDVIDIVNVMSDVIYEELGVTLSRSIYYSLALHFIYTIKYDLRNIDYMSIPNDEKIKIKYSDEYRTSRRIIKKIEKEFGICCPEYEEYFLTIVLSSLKENKNENHVGILVIVHGEATASNFAGVANELLGTNIVNSIDMPLNEKPDDILLKAIDMVKKIDQGKGVLLLVDMGSLVTFSSIIHEKTGVDVRVLDNISTLTVIEAARKALIPNLDIESIISSLINMNQTLNERLRRRIEEESNKDIKKVIYTVCASGQGTAFYLEDSIKKILTENHIYNVKVIPLSLANNKQFREVIADTAKDKYIVAIVGSIDPMIEEYPFISLQEIIMNNGLKKLLKLVNPDISLYNDEECIHKINKEIVWKATTEVIEKYLQFLSAEKVLPYVRDFISTLENKIYTNLKESIIVRIYIHIACMIERILFKRDHLNAGVDIKEYMIENESLWRAVKDSINKIQEVFNLDILDDEIYYIVELLKDENAV
ncbi:sigma-54-dependent transcriptional regulator [Acidilutibacter cellobiosedens]|uniref:Sigma-54-dependent transcriptional regulator n=1 Tax=Acidilutibacter cellobiosedens TaxID=2507161 RepID=A0A410QGT8_9FIRM|nr:sigma-54-dependent transcriptional regulator [Acidilutibacter cellobiosedens]QAT63054.1 sigma-54-dependent transcriptional regulator [Acidilutibacter cellobiosedens]HBN05150.1 hypothetical protein [Bacteroidales bacterium]